jgi:hypothetical protein
MGYLLWEWEYFFDWDFVRYGCGYPSWKQWPVEGVYSSKAPMVKSFVTLLKDRFGLHTPVQQPKPGISLTMAASLSREAINVSMSVIMVGPNSHGDVPVKS